MRFMVIGIGNEGVRDGPPPKPEAFVAMQKYNEELVKAGVPPRRRGTHRELEGCAREVQRRQAIVTDGPFAETRRSSRLLDHQASSMEEAIEWVKRAPNVSPNGEARSRSAGLMDVEDFGEGFTAEPGNRQSEVQVDAIPETPRC
jgi:hypothetical protein